MAYNLSMPLRNNHEQKDPGLRVLMLATSYPLGPGDSSSVFLRYLAEQLHHQGTDVHVLVPAKTRGGSTTEDGIHVHRFRYMFGPWQKLCYGSGVLPNLKKRPWLWLVVPFFLLNFFGASLVQAIRLRPDVVHGHWVLPTGLIALLVSRMLRRPFVVTAHGSDAFSVKAGLMPAIKKFIVRRANIWTANTAVTAGAIDDFRSMQNCRIIPMGVDSGLFVPARKKSGDGTRILYVGRLIKEKGVSVLLEAVAHLPDPLRSSIFLDIVGDGPDLKVLQQQARMLGIESRVSFAGSVPNEELPKIYQAASLFIGASDSEGQGVVYLEAMACGVPVIATNVGGVGEIIEHGVNGYLVAPRDPEAIAKAIVELLENDSRRLQLSDKARQQVVQHYSWESVAKRFADSYREVLARK